MKSKIQGTLNISGENRNLISIQYENGDVYSHALPYKSANSELIQGFKDHDKVTAEVTIISKRVENFPITKNGVTEPEKLSHKKTIYDVVINKLEKMQ